ncbi:hypothetical protein NY10_1888 [Carnobacterium antarcticum]|nr:hypothetical protein NY10_1888 [Carnobacterium sp. CP1]
MVRFALFSFQRSNLVAVAVLTTSKYYQKLTYLSTTFLNLFFSLLRCIAATSTNITGSQTSVNTLLLKVFLFLTIHMNLN